MKHRLSSALVVLALSLTLFVTPAVAATLVVDNVTPGCDDTDGDPAYCTIQAAIDDALPGDTITVATGIYVEQLFITKSLILDGGGFAMIEAPAVLVADASGVMLNIVTIDGAGVAAEITGFTITGPGPSGCGSINSGLMVRGGADLNLHDNTISDIRDEPFSGCQNGQGIWVGRTAMATTGTATITNNVFSGYQKGGIVVDNVGSSAVITGNTVTGAGPTATIAHNGIQVSRGATATITGNTVSGHSYTGVEGAVGIMLYQAGSPTIIGPNTSVTSNELGIWTDLESTLADIDLSGVTGNVRDAVADFTGWSTPTAWFVDDDFSANISDADGGDIVDFPGASLHVFGFDAFATIQAAVDAASDGDTVSVAAGTYNEQVVINKGLTLNGDPGDAAAGPGPNAPVVDGENLFTDAFLIANGTSNVTIQGFEIRNYANMGATGEGNAVQAWVNGTDHITVNDNYMHDLDWNGVLVGNDNGGAVGHSYWTVARNILTDFGPDVFDVSGYGLEVSDATHVLIEDNVIDAGTGQPGTGILINFRAVSGEDIVIQRNEIRGEYDFAGINVQASTEYSTPSQLDNVQILDNDVEISGTAFAAVQIRNKLSGTVTNTTVSGNQLIHNGAGFGLRNWNGTETIDAEDNWWGDASGPYDDSTILPDACALPLENPAGLGSQVSGCVDYEPWSGQTPGQPTLLSPANNALLTDYKPTFDWTDVPGAAYYQIEINPNMPTATAVGNVTNSEWTPANDLPKASRFFWRVRAFNSLDIAGPWSATWSFRTAVLAPTLRRPTNGDTLTDRTPTFIWNAAVGAQNYKLEVSLNQSFAHLVVSETVSGLTYTLPANLAPNKTYYWRVRTNSTQFGPSEWSQVRMFKEAGLALPAPTLQKPNNGGQITDQTPGFNWLDVAGAEGYTIQISRLANFSKLVKVETVTKSQYIMENAMQKNVTFYWRVRAIGPEGFGAWSATWSFSIK